MRERLAAFFKKHFSYEALMKKAALLNAYNFIEIAIVVFFSHMTYDLLQWYKEIMTVEKFNGIAFWGAISGLVAAIFGAIKYINDTHKKG